MFIFLITLHYSHGHGCPVLRFLSSSMTISRQDLTTFICYLCKHYVQGKDFDKNIAIVTHSNFMMNIFKIKKRMNNNAIYEVQIDTNKKE